MIVVYRYFLGTPIYDRMYDTKPMPGRPSPGGGLKIQGRLERAGGVVTTAQNPASWRARMLSDGTIAEDLPDFSDAEEVEHERMWNIYEGVQSDIMALQRGSTRVSPERVLMLLRVFAGIFPERLAGPDWEGSYVYVQGHGGAPDLAALYEEGESKESALSKIRSDLHHASKEVERLLDAADSIVGNLAMPEAAMPEAEDERPAVDLKTAMEFFNKKKVKVTKPADPETVAEFLKKKKSAEEGE